jgi:hypothetical protein
MPTVVKVLGGYLEVDIGGTSGSGPVDPGYGQQTPPGQIWGGAGQPYPPGSGQPGSPGWTPHPEHPIPPGIWHGGMPGGGGGSGGQPPHPSQGPGFPTHPIFIPPNQPPVDPPEDQSKIEWKSGWTADQGWVTVGIVTPEFPHPTPSS